MQPRHATEHRFNRTQITGFTLVEVLVALTIFAIMGLASYQLLSGEVRAQQQLQAASVRLHHLQRGLNRLSMDIRQIIPRPIRADYGESEPALTGSSDQMTFTHAGWHNPLNRPRSDLQRVHYGVVQTETGAYLERAFWSQLDRAPGSEPVRQTVVPGLTDIRLRYFDEDNREWVEDWPMTGKAASNDSAALPAAIEVRMTSPFYGEISRLFTLRATP